jgi:hypothetical protein
LLDGTVQSEAALAASSLKWKPRHGRGGVGRSGVSTYPPFDFVRLERGRPFRRQTDDAGKRSGRPSFCGLAGHPPLAQACPQTRFPDPRGSEGNGSNQRELVRDQSYATGLTGAINARFAPIHLLLGGSDEKCQTHGHFLHLLPSILFYRRYLGIAQEILHRVVQQFQWLREPMLGSAGNGKCSSINGLSATFAPPTWSPLSYTPATFSKKSCPDKDL